MNLPWDLFLGRVRESGAYTTDKETESVVRAVLAALGAQLEGEVRTDLAAQLPLRCKPLLLDPLPATRPMTPTEFVAAVTLLIDGATEETARWDASAVLTTVADCVDSQLVQQMLVQLPPGYGLLFGHPVHT
ncbi:DUF2267 domain-containing protein [Streptomyces sp. NPDC007251]|uniref:DUF2267 domain-containing protein n=1 Tax=Streptomyces sp. NPDC007251 TaxID=3154483 RepID=UPI0033F3BFF3